MVKVDKDDLLWYFYKKAYELDECVHYKSPKSICSYFWTAVWGMLLCWCQKAPLLTNWVGGGIITALGLILMTSSNSVGILIGMFLFAIGAIPPFFITGSRLKGENFAAYLGFWGGVGSTIIVTLVTILIAELINNPPVITWWDVLTFIMLIALSLVAFILLIAAIIGAAFGVSWLIDKAGATATGKSIWLFACAVKDRACPMMIVDPELEPGYVDEVEEEDENENEDVVEETEVESDTEIEEEVKVEEEIDVQIETKEENSSEQ